MRLSLRRLAGSGLLSVVAVAGPGCGPDTVTLVSRPGVGDVAVYRISVRAVTVTSIGDETPRRRVAASVLTARHRVLASGAEGTRVKVRLEQEAGDTATFVVRFDRAAQLAGFQRIEGLPAEALDELGLSEILPVAAAGPPRRPLAPGDHWAIDGPVQLAAGTTRLVGQGRLVALGVADGRRLAQVDTTYRLPVRRTAAELGGRVLLEGTLGTRARVAYDLDDDEVVTARTRTTGRYALTLVPPAGLGGAAVPGTLDVDVSSTSRRIG